MEISEVSNNTFTVPNRFWQTFESAFTTPSPGTSSTFGATPILIPKARITQPMKIVRLHEEEGRTYQSITSEYGVSKASISKWCSQLREECQTSPEIKEEYDYMKEMLKFRKENEELRKENLFLKKAAAFFAKEID